MKFTWLCILPLAAFLVLLAPAGAWSQEAFDPAARAAAVAPYLDDQTIAVAHVDIARIDPAALTKALTEIVPAGDPSIPKQLAAIEQGIKVVQSALKGVGMTDLYAVVSLHEVPNSTPFVVAPLKAGADPTMAAGMLRELTRVEASEQIGNAIVAGPKPTIERLKQLKPTARPELVKAFQLAGDTTAQAIFSPTADTRRVLREMLPRLPDEIGGGSGDMLADGIQWAVLSVDTPPKLNLALTVQSKDAESAASVREIAVKLLQMAWDDDGVKQIPKLDEVTRLLTPQVKGDQLTIRISSQDGSAQTLLGILTPAFSAASIANRRMQSSNNLKQIALAMHNYEGTHRRFPPQAIKSKDGKPLLSWRVAILPYLENNELYQQFKLDEPWDSEHNKKLIEKMPQVYLSQGLANLPEKGRTTYLAPLAERTVFSAHPEGVKIAAITDGTSNTIMILEANPKAAVIWTKPDDLPVDLKMPHKNLEGPEGKIFLSAFCDGSIHFISKTVDAETLRRLFQIDDGQPIGEF